MFLRNVIGSSISEYPALFTSKQNKMASSFVYVTEEPFFNKQSRYTRQCQTNNEIWQLSIQRYIFLLLFSDKFTQDVFIMFFLQMMSGRQADVP